MSNLAISLKGVSKTYMFKKHKGLKSFWNPEKVNVEAVKDISFSVNPGEAVAFIGPNGAGKSTTIKMLSGILTPTGGKLRVLGLEPVSQRRELAMKIGTVFGQRSQLVFNLPLTDSFDLTAQMYRVPRVEAGKRMEKLIDQFDLGSFVEQPVRKLSLGQRMRAEVANALLHNPDIIFLDEPTIGLDIVAKRALRETIKSINKERGTTVFLTSHDIGDIEEVCQRTMIVNYGQIVLDAQTADLKKTYLRGKTVIVVSNKNLKQPPVVAGMVPALRDGRIVYDVDTDVISLKNFIGKLLEAIDDIADLTIEDTPLEDIIHDLYVKER